MYMYPNCLCIKIPVTENMSVFRLITEHVCKYNNKQRTFLNKIRNNIIYVAVGLSFQLYTDNRCNYLRIWLRFFTTNIKTGFIACHFFLYSLTGTGWYVLYRMSKLLPKNVYHWKDLLTNSRFKCNYYNMWIADMLIKTWLINIPFVRWTPFLYYSSKGSYFITNIRNKSNL